jgi:predicted nucleic acid-binding protein
VILVDTSVWVDHLRQGNTRLRDLLAEARVAGHPFVTGEVAMGHLRRSSEILTLLGNLPQAAQAEHEEVLRFVAEHELAGSGVGWIDAHLLCSAALDGSRLWTLDRRLAAVAAQLGLGDRSRPL